MNVSSGTGHDPESRKMVVCVCVGTMMHIYPPTRLATKNLIFGKFKMADGHYFENKIIAISPRLLASFDENLHADAY